MFFFLPSQRSIIVLPISHCHEREQLYQVAERSGGMTITLFTVTLKATLAVQAKCCLFAFREGGCTLRPAVSGGLGGEAPNTTVSVAQEVVCERRHGVPTCFCPAVLIRVFWAVSLLQVPTGKVEQESRQHRKI